MGFQLTLVVFAAVEEVEWIKRSDSVYPYPFVRSMTAADTALAKARRVFSEQNKDAHENLAQFHIPGDQAPRKFSGAELEKLARLGHATDHQTTSAGNNGHSPVNSPGSCTVIIRSPSRAASGFPDTND